MWMMHYYDDDSGTVSCTMMMKNTRFHNSQKVSVIPQGVIKPLIDKYVQFEFGRSPNERDEKRRATPLIEAVKNNDETSVFLLLLIYSNSNNHDKNNGSTTTHSSLEGEGEAYINAHDRFQKTALHWAVQQQQQQQQHPHNNDFTIVQLLLQSGASIDVKGPRGRTPLHLSILHENQPMSQLLLERGANVHAADECGQTALYHASCKGDESIVRRILVATDKVNSNISSNVNSTDIYGDTPLHQAAWNGHLAVAKLLLDHGAEINVTNLKRRRTPLHMAAYGCQETMVGLLLEHNADFDAQDAELSTALHFAAQMGHECIIGKLINVGANWNITDRHGRTMVELLHSWPHHGWGITERLRGPAGICGGSGST